MIFNGKKVEDNSFTAHRVLYIHILKLGFSMNSWAVRLAAKSVIENVELIK